MSEDVYAFVDVPGVGIKKVLVVSDGRAVLDYGGLEDCFVTLENGKRALAILGFITGEFPTMKVGDIEAGDFFEIEEDGTWVNKGEGTVWDEVSNPIFAARLDTGSGRIDYNYDELTVDFATNARYPEEPAPIVIQAMHSWKIGGKVRPHIHWIQNSNNTPNILVAYRFYNNGEAPGAFTLKALTAANNQITYPGSGSIQQITNLDIPEVDFSSMGLSFTFDCRIYRDTQNASLLFAGADSYSGVWSAKYYDIHYEKNMNGSREEFTK